MKHDQIEMLYWLQQERRQTQLQGTSLVLPPLIAPELPPQTTRLGPTPLRPIGSADMSAMTALSATD